jgi:hypothetical protein
VIRRYAQPGQQAAPVSTEVKAGIKT